ncbi:MAG: hypothetical protein C4292_05130 [Nitrososphaera sp.]
MSVAETIMVDQAEVAGDTAAATAAAEQMTLPMQEGSAVQTNSEAMVEQVLSSLKKADAERSRHARQVEQQNKKLLSQINQMRKQIARSKKSAAVKATKGANKGKGKRKAKGAKRR